MSALPASTVAKLTGLTMRQLRYLQQTGLVTPTVRSRPGAGNDTLYAASDLFALKVVERVRAVCGQEVRLDKLRTVLSTMSSRTPGGGGHLVLDGEGCWLQDGGLEDLLPRLSGAALILDLDTISADVDLRLRRAGLSESSALAAA